MKRFLQETKYIDYKSDIIQQAVSKLFSDGMSEFEKAKIAYEFVRDEIPIHLIAMRSTLRQKLRMY